MPEQVLQNSTKPKKWYLRKLAIVSYALLLMLFYFSLKSDPSQTTPPQVDNLVQEDMQLNVRQSTIYEATGYGNSQSVIAIKNLNSFKWENCKVTLNDIYTASLDFIATPSDLKTTTTDTHDSMVITERNFAKSDGTPFNDISQIPLKVSVSCEKPYSGFWFGNFKH